MTIHFALAVMTALLGDPQSAYPECRVDRNSKVCNIARVTARIRRQELRLLEIQSSDWDDSKKMLHIDALKGLIKINTHLLRAIEKRPD